MNKWKLLRRGLYYHRQALIWVVLGCSISTTILVGALVTGDSVRYSLRRIVYDRLGKTEFALMSGDRFFRTRLAEELEKKLDTSVAPLLQTQGMAIVEGGRRRVNQVQIIGVDGRFGEIGGNPELFDSLAANEAVINFSLARRLEVGAGDDIVLRIKKLDFLPKETPLSLESDITFARRVRIKAVASDADFGRFNLKTNQVAPLSAFVSLSSLSQSMGWDFRSNTLLVAERSQVPLDPNELQAAFKELWSLDDAGFYFKDLPDGEAVELRSNRIFIETVFSELDLYPQIERHEILTYFVNEIGFEDRSTPYSFVSSLGDAWIPPGMKDDEILINHWLAEDLGAEAGDQVKLSYFALSGTRSLIEKSGFFRIKAIVPLQGIYSDRDLLPDFPGLADIENTRDWRPGIPVNLDLIREKDEAYWDRYRGTPKAFVTLAAGQRMWRNRFGDLTAIRYTGIDRSGLEAELKKVLDPERLGFVFRDVKKEGLRAGSQSVDFGQLFLGLSFFIVAAALLLMGLLFVFNLEKRSEEKGLLMALGFSRRQIRRLVLLEGGVLVVAGSLIGCITGLVYNSLILTALKSIWKGIVGISALRLYINPLTIFVGTLAGIGAAFFSILLMTRKLLRQPVSELQKGLSKIARPDAKKRAAGWLMGILFLLSAVMILVLTDFNRGRDAFAAFFSAGFLILAGGVAFAGIILSGFGKKSSVRHLNLTALGIRSASRNKVRSLTLLGLLASGLFIVFTVGANRRNVVKDAESRISGTGGFALFGESIIPVLYDLNSREGARFYGLERLQPGSAGFVQFRVKEGDDASCLNLNRVASPQLIGVEPKLLSQRKSFRFAQTSEDIDPSDPWMGLEKILPDGTIPAVADQTVIVWGLGKAVGDVLVYLDENGEEYRIKLVGGLVNSIFQGNLIVSENLLLQKYPSLSGYRMFLIETSWESAPRISEEISYAMQDQGLDLVSTAERLAQFNQIENTYLSIFMILGSFGLILGSIGIAVVVGRNVNERQGELALLRAVGFSRGSLKIMILAEHLALLAAGIGLGLTAATLATLPALGVPGADIPFGTILILLAMVLCNGIFWTYTATRQAVRMDLLPTLRKE